MRDCGIYYYENINAILKKFHSFLSNYTLEKCKNVKDGG